LTERNLVKVNEGNAVLFYVTLKLYFAGLISICAVRLLRSRVRIPPESMDVCLL